MRLTGVIAAACVVAGGSAGVGEAETAAPAARVEIVNANTPMRAAFGWKTAVYITADGQVKVPVAGKEAKPLPDFATPPVPADWTKPEFDDSSWVRLRGGYEATATTHQDDPAGAPWSAVENYLICARARFRVDDPQAVKDLTLSVEYVGGVVVYVNGREVARGHLPAGPLDQDALAQKYPDDLCVDPDGFYVHSSKLDKAKKDEMTAARVRQLADVAVPADALRKGLNVLAVEVHRAPLNEGAVTAKRIPLGGMYRVWGFYACAALRALRVTAPADAAVVPNVARPKGVYVWNCPPIETVLAAGFADPAESVQPVVVSGVRNGVFSGRLVVSADGPVKGLKVSISDLAQAGGTGKIPTSAVRVRYAAPADPAKVWVPRQRFDGLLDQPDTAAGVVPVWLTVRIPPDAPAGRYEGQVALEADGLSRTTVPFHLTVHGWRLPDSREWTVKNVGQSMTEHLAQFYGVPLWSDRHFDLIARSMQVMAQINDRSAIVDLTIPGNYAFNNTETMVRWVRKQGSGVRNPDSTSFNLTPDTRHLTPDAFTYDFTVFDKYLDVVARTAGKPLPLRINICTRVDKKEGKRVQAFGNRVSLLDPATGQLDQLETPVPGTPEWVPFWKPVLDEVKKRIEARGWWDVTGLGDTQYAGGPDAETIAAFKEIWPDLKGVSQQHGLAATFAGGVPVIVAGTVWNEGRLSARGYRGLWNKKPWLMCGDFARNRHGDASPLAAVRMLPEEMIMRGHHGVFPLGEDLWVLHDARGRAWNVSGTSALGPGCSTKALLAPGPDGAAPSERFEMFRESDQVCEAILFLQRGLDEGRITGDLAERVNRTLDERAQEFFRAHRALGGGGRPYWTAFEGSGWQARDDRLFALCAEAAGHAAPGESAEGRTPPQ